MKPVNDARIAAPNWPALMKRRATGRNEKCFQEIFDTFQSLGKFRKNKELNRTLSRCEPSPGDGFSPKSFLPPRNIPGGLFVYTSAAGNEAVPGKPEKPKLKTPRWQPRGGDTQVFPAVSPGRGGVFEARLLARGTRVNSLSSPGSLQRLTRSRWKGK